LVVFLHIPLIWCRISFSVINFLYSLKITRLFLYQVSSFTHMKKKKNSIYLIVQDKRDVEWKFIRTELWLSFIDPGCPVAPPFNIIPTPRSFASIFKFVKSHICVCNGDNEPETKEIDNQVNVLVLLYWNQLDIVNSTFIFFGGVSGSFLCWVSCCDFYDFCIKTMFGSPLPPVVCRRAHVSFVLFALVCVEWCPAHIVFCFSSSCVHCVAGFWIVQFWLPLRYSLTFI